ncbi:MAG: polyprenyl synthetase family protein, partial [Aurantimonas coralicida]
AATIGKDVNKDAGKSTIVSMLGRASVEHRIERHVEAAHGELTLVFGASSRLHRLTDAIVALPGGAAADTACDKTRFREPEAGAR